MIIKAYNNEPVTISGGVPLDVPIGEWVNEGQIRTASFALEKCGEIFQGKNRLLPARSPNVDWGFNKNVASGEYHYMKVRNEIYSGVATQVDQKTQRRLALRSSDRAVSIGSGSRTMSLDTDPPRRPRWAG